MYLEKNTTALQKENKNSLKKEFYCKDLNMTCEFPEEKWKKKYSTVKPKRGVVTPRGRKPRTSKRKRAQNIKF